MRWADLAANASMATAASMLAWGLWQADCVLVAGSALAAQRSFLLCMELRGPAQPLDIATRCITAGSAGILASVVLLAMVLGTHFGWWWAAHDTDLVTVAWLAACALVFVVAQPDGRSALNEALLWAIVVGGAMAASLSGPVLSISAGCIFAVATGMLVGARAWRLLSTVAPEYLRQSIEPS